MFFFFHSTFFCIFKVLPELKKTQVFSMPIYAPLANFRNNLLVTKLKLFSRSFFWAQSHICSFIRLEVTFEWRWVSQNFISQLEEKEAISNWISFLYGCQFCNHLSIHAHFFTIWMKYDKNYRTLVLNKIVNEQIRIHGKTVADGWAVAVMQKPLAI